MEKIVNLFNKSVFHDDNSIKVNCPICGIFTVSFDKPDHITGEDYKVWKGQGECVKVPMQCSEGHAWTYCFGYHKGEVFTYMDDIKNLKEQIDFGDPQR